MDRPTIVQAQCSTCHWNAVEAICLKGRKRSHQTAEDTYFRNVDCNQWESMRADALVPDVCPTCGRPIPKEKKLET